MAQYITEDGARRVEKYRYAGSDDSFLYHYFCSPLAEFLVRTCVPLWVAPNLITCLGLLPSLCGHAVIWYYCADLRSSCPRWCWALVSVCTFAYQTIDNMDGKQARRTGSSTALGLLLDHGIDALNIILSSLNCMAMLKCGDSAGECLLIWLLCAAPFFFATWEEFFTGALRLGVVNGPTDGVLIVCCLQLVSAVVEDYSAWWGEEPVAGMGISRKVLALGFYVVCVSATLASNFIMVMRSTGSVASFFSAALLTAPFVLFLLVISFWVLLSASGHAIFAAHPRLCVWLLGLIFMKLVVHLQLAHICGDAYYPWRKTLVLPALFLAWSFMTNMFRRVPATSNVVDESTLLQYCVMFLGVSMLHLAVIVTRELAKVLGVQVFALPSLRRD
eukprot:TRINITY_DN28957_c0_g1_i2.p1 TRINITY_DN28957_c0_g1~~TRINITY_DN28957_c0_g1_i2.p1  ORF type:complete len:414 (+),score=44.15 TRINITY_DN28957_c0_g1_i2:76-1242(+)